MEKNIRTHLGWMKEMIEKLERYTVHIHSYEQFVSDEKNIDLCIVPLIQIGEIAGSMSKIYTSVPDIPYKEIVGFRNILVHTYHKANPEVIYKIVFKSIPLLKEKILDYAKTHNIKI